MKPWHLKLKKSAARKSKRMAKRRLLGIKGSISKTVVKKALWDMVSLYVRLRDKALYGPMCRICGRRPIQCAYHLVPSNDGADTRYDPANIVGACSSCNFAEYHHRYSFQFKHEKLFGLELMDALREKSKAVVQYSRTDLLLLKAEFKRKIENREWR